MTLPNNSLDREHQKFIVDPSGNTAVNVVLSNTSDISSDEWVSGLGIDTEDVTNYYFGFIKVGATNWRVQRMNKTTYAISWASGEDDASTNWNNRTSLTYGDVL